MTVYYAMADALVVLVTEALGCLFSQAAKTKASLCRFYLKKLVCSLLTKNLAKKGGI
jgi:hypothetical protein